MQQLVAEMTCDEHFITIRLNDLQIVAIVKATTNCKRSDMFSYWNVNDNAHILVMCGFTGPTNS